MRIEEKHLILPTLYIIYRYDSCKITHIKNELFKVFKPDGEDAKILNNRKDTKFSQKVRNLKSHRATNTMEKYTFLSSSGNYTLSAAGKKYLNTNIDAMNYLFSNNFCYTDVIKFTDNCLNKTSKKEKIVIYDEEEKIAEGKITKKTVKHRERSKKLREAAIEHYKSKEGKLFCSVCGFCFEDKYGKLGEGFIEIHHEKPVCHSADEGFETYLSQAVNNVKPLCSNCHRMIHRETTVLSVSELKKLLK